jgi:glycosyltransferase involved in cell wall biosynthesis
MLDFTLNCSEQDRAALRSAAEERVSQRYSWDYVTDAYEHLFRTLLA